MILVFRPKRKRSWSWKRTFRTEPNYIAPKLYKCLQKYQFYWPEFNERGKLSVLFVDWYKEQAKTESNM